MDFIVGFLQTFQQPDAINHAAGTGDSNNDAFGVGHFSSFFQFIMQNFGLKNPQRHLKL
jgi:hypothetical protein